MAAIIFNGLVPGVSSEANEKLNLLSSDGVLGYALACRVDEISRDWIVKFVQEELLKNGGELVRVPMQEFLCSPSNSGIKPFELGEKKEDAKYRSFKHWAIKFDDICIPVPGEGQKKEFSEAFVSDCLKELYYFKFQKLIELGPYLEKELKDRNRFLESGIKFSCETVYKAVLGLPKGHVDLLCIYFEVLLEFDVVENKFCLQTIPVNRENGVSNYTALWEKNVFDPERPDLELFSYAPIPQALPYEPLSETTAEFRERMSIMRQELELDPLAIKEREKAEKERLLRLGHSSSVSEVKPQFTRSGHTEDVFEGFSIARKGKISPNIPPTIEIKQQITKSATLDLSTVTSTPTVSKSRKLSKSSPSSPSSKQPSRASSIPPSSQESSVSNQSDDGFRKGISILSVINALKNLFFGFLST